MKNTTALLSGMFLAASLALGVSSVQAEGVILRDRFPGPNCCPMSDIVEFYWPCDYDPVDCCPYFCDDVVMSRSPSQFHARDGAHRLVFRWSGDCV